MFLSRMLLAFPDLQTRKVIALSSALTVEPLFGVLPLTALPLLGVPPFVLGGSSMTLQIV